MSFDPTTTAELIAALTARSDGASFALTATDVPAGTGPDASPTVAPSTALAFAPRTFSPVRLAWSAVYRHTSLYGSLVCDAGSASVATGVLAQLALAAFDGLDVRLTTLGSTLPLGSTAP